MNDRPIHHVCYIVDDIPRRSTSGSRRPAPAPPSTWASTSSSTRRCWRESAACSGARVGFYSGGAGGGNIAHIAYIVDEPAAESERLEAA